MIDELHQKCTKLSEEIHRLRNKENIEVERRRLAEELCQLQSNQQQLENKIQNYADIFDYYRAKALRCSSGLEKIMPILEDVRKDITVGKSGVKLGIPGERIGLGRRQTSSPKDGSGDIRFIAVGANRHKESSFRESWDVPASIL